MQFDLIIKHWTLFYSGVTTTVMLIAVVFASSFVIALPLAVLRAYEVAGVRWVIHGYTRVAPGTGMVLQNRGANFSLDPDHPNALAGGKRPYHTIIPALATRGGELWLSFGVMGGFQQPQGHLQVVSNLVDFGMNPQHALDALRFRIDVAGNGEVGLEAGVAPEVAKALQDRGHRVRIVDGYERSFFGGGQIIARDPHSGALVAGSEPRCDGAAVGW